jgi:TonB family protein
MESTSQAGSGPAMPVGNSVRAPARRDVAPGAAPALAPPVPAYEVTTMPLPQGRCAGRYTDEAKAAAIEGTVVLDLVVGDNGRVREVSVVSGLGYGLTAAAITAVKECRFSPGEKDGTPVPVRVRGFKIRFVLGE